MTLPYSELPEDTKHEVMAELRAVLQEPDVQVAARRRHALAETLRRDYPEVADWIEDDGPDEACVDRHPLLQDLPASDAKLAALKGKIVVIKYGGNAMVDEAAKQSVIADIGVLKTCGVVPVVVHGGGPSISELLGKVGVHCSFVEGHRKTDRSAMSYVEMALSGKVNSEIVKLLGLHGHKAAGLSGKDGGLVTAEKRIHEVREGGAVRRCDLGLVGDVKSVNPDLIRTLLAGDYIPVIAPIGVGEDLEDYNINADMFAGHMAAALGATAYVALTDVDGVFLDKDDPASQIPTMSAHAARRELGHILQGGMIPKVESCLVALEGGVRRAHIVNGMAEHAVLEVLLTARTCGTTIAADPGGARGEAHAKDGRSEPGRERAIERAEGAAPGAENSRSEAA